MSEFFCGWRRKTGLVTLLMACVFMGLWVRSYQLIDMVGIPKSIGKHFLCSAPEGLVWIAHDYGADGRFEWVVLPVQLTNVSSYFNRMRTKPHWEFCGLYAGKSDGEGSPFYMIAAPYWSLIAPLTLITTYLLLFKPHKSTQKKIPELV